ncbi:MAG: SDR family oxidoreductase [Capnocytophaga sp.]|nr:SDR family oxidoreductase [Capnocytophaga sp.]
MRHSFTGKNVLITGGASGIGKIMLRKALERKADNVVIWDINGQGMEAVRQEFGLLGAIHTITVDLSDIESIQNAVTATQQRITHIDILINNAGIIIGKYFHEHSSDEITDTIHINTSAVMYTTHAFLPLMMKRNTGAICNIASSAGIIANPKMSVYAASKWAVVGWSDSLRLEMKQLSKNISVTTIMPYYINTGMFDGVQSKLLPILKPEPTAERIIRAVERGKSLYAIPLSYRFIRFSQGLLPLCLFDWVMKNVFGIYDTMTHFKGRK